MNLKVKVEGGDRITSLLKDKRYSIGQNFRRTMAALAGDIASAEREVFGSSRSNPGVWTMQTRLSVGNQFTMDSGTKFEIAIGPGMNKQRPLDPGRAKYGAWIINYGFAATSKKSWFVPYKGNPEFQNWAQAHGFRTTNKKGQVSGGLWVGGQQSKLRTGIQYKQKALDKIMPLFEKARIFFYQQFKKGL